ncbi:hypothetical protein V1477_017169 [Vespula maculifrons]|uniref:Uncharacterized protein n=1 Tax=Vespula maculifrons TaxID=7453 RepID=A0ABD2B5I9_VESMC
MDLDARGTSKNALARERRRQRISYDTCSKHKENVLIIVRLELTRANGTKTKVRLEQTIHKRVNYRRLSRIYTDVSKYTSTESEAPTFKQKILLPASHRNQGLLSRHTSNKYTVTARYERNGRVSLRDTDENLSSKQRLSENSRLKQYTFEAPPNRHF